MVYTKFQQWAMRGFLAITIVGLVAVQLVNNYGAQVEGADCGILCAHGLCFGGFLTFWKSLAFGIWVALGGPPRPNTPTISKK